VPQPALLRRSSHLRRPVGKRLLDHSIKRPLPARRLGDEEAVNLVRPGDEHLLDLPRLRSREEVLGDFNDDGTVLRHWGLDREERRGPSGPEHGSAASASRTVTDSRLRTATGFLRSPPPHFSSPTLALPQGVAFVAFRCTCGCAFHGVSHSQRQRKRQHSRVALSEDEWGAEEAKPPGPRPPNAGRRGAAPERSKGRAPSPPGDIRNGEPAMPGERGEMRPGSDESQ
jgi:hypothetical protein